MTDAEKTKALLEAKDLLTEADELMDQMAIEHLIETGILQAKINFLASILNEISASTDDEETKEAIKVALDINQNVQFKILKTDTDGETKH